MITYILLTIIVILIVGILLLTLSQRTQRRTGLPQGEIVYSDTGIRQDIDKPLVSYRYGLVGKPDYLLEIKEGWRTVTIPVEFKSRQMLGSTNVNHASQPHENHILQLGTYCLLLEDLEGEAPPYGYIRYADVTFKVPYTNTLRQQVLDIADEIRAAHTARDVPRQHDDAYRCGGCGYRHGCDEALSVG